MEDKDFSLKEEALRLNLDKKWGEMHQLAFNGDSKGLEEFKALLGDDMYRVCKNLNTSSYNRYKKCRNKIAGCVGSGQCWFGTLTLNNKKIGCKMSTLRKYVSRQLKKVSKVYVANIDYGDKAKNPNSKERLHFHFVLRSESKPDLSYWEKKCGFVKLRKVGDLESDVKRVSRYTAKLSRHALKVSTQHGSTKVPRLIYSRQGFNAWGCYIDPSEWDGSKLGR